MWTASLTTIVSSTVLVVSFAPPVAAQPTPSPLFVTAGAFADIQQFGHSSSQTTTPTVIFTAGQSDLGGTASGLAIGVGTYLTPRVAIQLELALPAMRHKALRPSQTTPPPPVLFSTRQEVDYRARTAGVLAAFRPQERHRVRAGYVGGVMFVEEHVRTVTTSTMTPPGTVTGRADFLSVAYRSAALLGFDTDVRLTSHVAVVPHVRFSKIFGSSVLLTRPGVSARWSF